MLSGEWTCAVGKSSMFQPLPKGDAPSGLYLALSAAEPNQIVAVDEARNSFFFTIGQRSSQVLLKI
jgi:hypothetical protein